MNLKFNIAFIFFCIVCITIKGQIVVSGQVVDENEIPAFGSNIAIKGNYKGVSTDLDGFYTIKVEPIDTLLFTYIGYITQEHIIDPEKGDSQIVNMSLQPEINLLSKAVISGKRKTEIARVSSANLSQQQIFTTAGEPGNVLLAAQGGSSASVNPATGRLLVRGGSNQETQFYMDGILIGTPYISTPHGISTRLQQTPYMVDKIELHNGSFSAEYGQALSSIVELNTKEKLKEDDYSLSISTVGLNANLQKKVGKGGILLNSDFIDLTINNHLTISDLNWIKPYRSFSNQLLWETPINQDKKLKFYANNSFNNMKVSSYYNSEKHSIEIKGNNLNFSVFYKQLLSSKWDFSVASSFQKSNNETIIESNLNEKVNNNYTHTKAVVRYFYNKNLKLKGGIEHFYNNSDQKVTFKEGAFKIDNDSKQQNFALFIEGEQKIGSHFTVRPGIRVDDVNNSRRVFAFRTLLGCELNNHITLTGFYGTFYQLPNLEFIYYNPSLQNEQSEQLSFTFNYHKNNRDFSLSLYRKNYRDLVKYIGDYRLNPEQLTNNGKGFAEGIDIMFTDKKTIPSGELKYNYSYINSLRFSNEYIDYTQPSFIYKHWLTFSAKKFLPRISSNVSITANLATGKYFDNPFTINEIEKDSLKPYKNISFNCTYITRFWGSSISYIHLSVDNILNLKNEVSLLYQDSKTFITQENNNQRSIFVAFIINLK